MKNSWTLWKIDYPFNKQQPVKNIDLRKISSVDERISVEKEYWFDTLWAFNAIEWISRFTRLDKTQWWIRYDWIIISEGYRICWYFHEWLSLFIKQDGSRGWIKEDWTILLEWFDRVNDFQNWIALFKKDWIEWMININNNFSSWFCIFDWINELISNNWKEYIEQWWVWTNAKIFKNWYNKCYPFNDELKWYAKFEKNWYIWYINTEWVEFDFKNIFPFDEEFEWYAKIKRKDDTIWYIDEKHKEWEDIQNRNWTIYLKKDWKWFNKKLIK
jgi:hypothetical protein